MIRSMTGYGRVQQVSGGYNVLVEIKSVNHRFYEFSARVPRCYGYIEEKMKAYVQRFISRGKVDVFITVERLEGAAGQVKLNESLARSYLGAMRELSEKFGLKDDLTVSSVSRLPDLFTVLRSPEDEDEVWEAVRSAADGAVGEFVRMRESEGARLGADIAARAETIRTLVGEVERRSPDTVREYREKLAARMAELLPGTPADDTRLMTEAALYADRVSVTEETVRLKSHLAELRKMLDGEGPTGRKLDFLMQEMNREANTIGSKASDVKIARMVVDIKAELEKIREQIQNIE